MITLSLEHMVTGLYTDDCRKAVAELQLPKTGRVDIKIVEMKPNNGQWWLRIVFSINDFLQLTESEQYKWAGYIVDLRNTLTKLNKLVEVLRLDEAT